MTLFADLMLGIGVGYGVAFVSIYILLTKRRRTRRANESLIMIDQHTEKRRLQHANVGHKAAKGFQGKH